MENLVVVNKNELYGYADEKNNIVIPAIYKEAYPFSCGLAMVVNENHQYAYINESGKQIIPFGKYYWCDTHFVYGYARVVSSNNKWSIINTLGVVITDKEYDKIWAIKPEYISKVKANIGDTEYVFDLLKSLTPHILTGLRYINTFTIEEYKEFFQVPKIDIKVSLKTNLLYFIDGKNIGEVCAKDIPEFPVISVVSNSYGKIFLLLHEKEDIGKVSFVRKYYVPPKSKSNKTQRSSMTSFWDYENEKMHESYDDPLFYNNDGWIQNEIDSGLADAFEGDSSAYDRW